MIDMQITLRAVHYAAEEHGTWARVDLDERRARVVDCIGRLGEYRELPATLLVSAA
jgi:hypothetical protein